MPRGNKTYTQMKMLYLTPFDLKFAEEMTWRGRHKSVSDYMRYLLHEEMKKNPDAVKNVKSV